jgi:hypothetical protein
MISPCTRNFLGSTLVNMESLRNTDGEQHLHPVDDVAKAVLPNSAIALDGLVIRWKTLSVDDRFEQRIGVPGRDGARANSARKQA